MQADLILIHAARSFIFQSNTLDYNLLIFKH